MGKIRLTATVADFSKSLVNKTEKTVVANANNTIKNRETDFIKIRWLVRQ